jgi:hypothetical protein
MTDLNHLISDPRVTIRRKGVSEPSGRCVVYWIMSGKCCSKKFDADQYIGQMAKLAGANDQSELFVR